MGAQHFKFAPEFPQMEIFSPHFAFFDKKKIIRRSYDSSTSSGDCPPCTHCHDDAGYTCDVVLVSEADGAQAVRSHRLNHRAYHHLLVLHRELVSFTVLAQYPVAPGQTSRDVGSVLTSHAAVGSIPKRTKTETAQTKTAHNFLTC